MQKHEREALDVAREEIAKLSGDLTVAVRESRGRKRRLVLTGPRGTVFKVISSSPGSRDIEMDHTRRWARREGSKLL